MWIDSCERGSSKRQGRASKQPAHFGGFTQVDFDDIVPPILEDGVRSGKSFVGGDGIRSDAEHIALHVLHFFGCYLTDVRTIVSVEQGTELFFTLESRGVHQHVAHA